MSNVYTGFCVALSDVTPEELEWLQRWIDPDKITEEEYLSLAIPAGLDADQKENWPGHLTTWGAELDTVYFLDNHGSADLELFMYFIQLFLKTFRPKGTFDFSWSETCDRGVPDAFGGGAAFITATDVSVCTTAQWLFDSRIEHQPFEATMVEEKELKRDKH